LGELINVLVVLETYPQARCTFITGANDKAFDAGAAIREMQAKTGAELSSEDFSPIGATVC